MHDVKSPEKFSGLFSSLIQDLMQLPNQRLRICSLESLAIKHGHQHLPARPAFAQTGDYLNLESGKLPLHHLDSIYRPTVVLTEFQFQAGVAGGGVNTLVPSSLSSISWP